jgi:hypothetical protein
MNNKLIFLIVVIVLLFSLIFIIRKNRIAREKIRIEEKIHTARQQFMQDSLQNIRAEIDKNRTVIVREAGESKGSNTSAIIEDYSTYINTASTKSDSKTNIAVTIVDESGNISSSISGSIANVYNQTGNNGITGLLRSSFIKSSGFQELFEGNSEIIEKLKLSSRTDYVALGRIGYSTRKGTLVDGTYVCTVSISVSIISPSQKSIAKSFSFSENGNGASETQAQNAATEKLINKYYTEYSSL